MDVFKSGDPKFDKIRGAVVSKVRGDDGSVRDGAILGIPFAAQTSTTDTASDSAVMYLDENNSGRVLSIPDSTFAAFQIDVITACTVASGGSSEERYTFGRWVGDIIIEPDGTVNETWSADANNSAQRVTFDVPAVTLVGNALVITVGHTGTTAGYTLTLEWSAVLKGHSIKGVAVVYYC